MCQYNGWSEVFLIDLFVEGKHPDPQIRAEVFDFHIFTSKKLWQKIIRNALGELHVQILEFFFVGRNIRSLRTEEVKMVHITYYYI